MKRLRILSFLVLTLGVLYLAGSGLSLYYYRNLLSTFAYYGVSDEVQLSIPEIARVRAMLKGGFIILLVVGVVVLCVGIGLFLSKSWARKTWLILVSVLSVFHLVRLVLDYQLSDFILFERIGEVVIVGGLATLSWFWLRREFSKQDVHNTQAAT